MFNSVSFTAFTSQQIPNQNLIDSNGDGMCRQPNNGAWDKSADNCSSLTKRPSKSPTESPTSSPSKSPSKGPSLSPVSEGCFPLAKKVKVQSLTGLPIQMIELQVISKGSNVAIGKDATQSSTFKDKVASKAVDGKMNSFSHTGSDNCGGWWQIDLGDSFTIESIKILNRWCSNPSDSIGCLCRLSQAAISLFSHDGKWVNAAFNGDTCKLLEVNHEFKASPEYCV
jgi:hypothetical protein